MSGKKEKTRLEPRARSARPAVRHDRQPEPEKWRGGLNEARAMSRFTMSTVVIVIAIVTLIMVSLPTFVVVAVGMVPTVVHFITRQEQESSRSWSLAAINLAGVLPYLADLWRDHPKLDDAFRIIADPYALCVMLGSAALALAIFWAAPQVAASIINVNAGRRLSGLVKAKDALIKEWGPEVSSSASAAPAASPAAASTPSATRVKADY